ncbi:hypothetical protein LSH36_989g00025 [Paralvinella palmiformis]|uniref:G-protein coupled receptors family 1 profile domain-containing protein n=1 Tax=Paralvinella palmiformis TaxID=53620 RepID=A0AAD9IX34_9ANNE|nr:hypothetical protein LSH36_989g00025 [Paralvinella palmiformis]
MLGPSSWWNCSSRQMCNKQTVTYWLIALTAVDLSGLLCSWLFINNIPSALNDLHNRTAGGSRRWAYDAPLTVQHVVWSLHVLFLLGMSIDRYIMIAKPESSRIWTSKSVAIVSIFLLAAASIGLHLPGYFVGVPEPGIGEGFQIRYSVAYSWLYIFGIRLLLLFAIPVLILAVFLCLLTKRSFISKRKFSR